MKKILFAFAFLLPVLAGAQSQILKTAGIPYTGSAPTYTPSASGSNWAIDTSGLDLYVWTGASWSLAGERIQTVSGCSAPLYTPGKGQSLFVVNGCDSVYYYRAGAWRHVNKAGAVASIDSTTARNTGPTGQGVYSHEANNALNFRRLIGGTGMTLTGADSSITITNSAPDQTVTLSGTGITVGGAYPTFTLTAADQSATNEIQTLNLAGQTLSISSGNNVTLPIVNVSAGTGTTVSIASGNATVSANDASATNELQTIDTLTIVSNVLRASLSNDSQPFKSVSLLPYLDNTDAQTLSIDSTTVGGVERFSVTISNGNTIRFDIPQGIFLTDGNKGDITVSGSGATWSINAGAVTLADMAAASVDSTKIADGALGVSDLNQSGATTGQVLKWNGANWRPGTDETAAGGGATNLTFTGTTSPFTLNSDTGTDVTFAQGSGITLSRSTNELTVTAVDASATNEIQSLTIDSAIVGSVERFSVGITSGNTVTFDVPQVAPVTDGDKGDIDVTNSGATWAIDTAAVNNLKLASGTGGIYKGNGDIPNNTTANVTGYFNFQYDTGDSEAISIDNATGAVLLTNSAANGSILLQNDSTTFEATKFIFTGDTIDISGVTTKIGFPAGVSVTLDGEVNGLSSATTVDTVRRVWFDRAYNQPDSLGKMQWDAANETVKIGVGETTLQTTVQVGQEALYPKVINKTTSIIRKGVPVMVDTVAVIQGDNIRVRPAIGSTTQNVATIMGIATHDISVDGTGFVTWFGYVTEVDEANIAQTGITFAAGQILYLSATERGRLTNVLPTAPNIKDPIAIVVRRPTANNLTLLVRPQLTPDIHDVNDILITSPTAGQILEYNSAGFWENGQIGLAGIEANAIDSTKIRNNGISVLDIAPNGATSGQVLKYNGTQWAPAADNNTGTDLTLTGSASPFTLNSSTGTDVTIASGTGISLSRSTNQLTVTNSAPDQTVAITGTGITVGGTYPSFTLTAADQSATNEIQTLTIDSAIVGGVERFSVGITPSGNTVRFDVPQGVFVTDGDKGDIDVTSSGAVWTVDTGAVNNLKLASGSGGIYKGSGTVPNSTISSLAGEYRIVYDNAATAIGISNNPSPSLQFNDRSETNAILFYQNEILFAGEKMRFSADTIDISGVPVKIGFPSGGGGVTDGDKGDIDVTGSGTTWTIDTAAVNNLKLASGTGGIYKGSGTIATEANAEVTDIFSISYNNGQYAFYAQNYGGEVGISDSVNMHTITARLDSINVTGKRINYNIDTIDISRVPVKIGFPSGGGGVTDGDKGDIDVTNSGTTWTIDTAAVTLLKMAANSIDSTKIVNLGIGYGDITGANATIGQALKWNGTNWHPAADDNTGTNLSFTGSASPFTLNSSTGTEVTFAQGSGIALSRSTDELTVRADTALLATLNDLEIPRDTALKAATHTAAINNIALIDCKLAPRTVNPPLSAVNGDWFVVSDARAASGANNITVAFVAAGQKIYGVVSDYIINSNGGYVKFIFVNANTGWIATKG